MSTSLFLAQLLGPVLVVLGLSFLVHRERIRAIFADLSRAPGEVYFAEIFALVAGLAIILSHNVWAGSWEILITILGWAAFLKGIALALWPDEMLATGRSMIGGPLMAVVWILPVAAGLWLSWAGYFSASGM